MSQKEFIPQYPTSLVKQITEFITSSIIEGRLQGGERLIERELGRKFGISRAPIREAFCILDQKGLVVNIPRKGTFVRKITQKDVEEHFPIRAVLEGLAAKLAVNNFRAEDIKDMELALSRMKAAVRKNDFKSYLEHHARYHEIFISRSRNDTLIEIIKNLLRQAIWFRFIYHYFQMSYEYSLHVHKEIIELFKKGDTDRVEALVKEHILISLNMKNWDQPF